MIRSRTIILFFVLTAVLLAACDLDRDQVNIEGSGDVVTLEEDLSGFDKLRISHAFQVEVKQGDSYRIVVRVDDNVQEYLMVEKDDDTLRIGLDSDHSYNIRNATLEAEVTMPDLAGLRSSGSSDVLITGFASNHSFDGDLSGSSTLRGDLQSGGASFDVSGSSDVTLTGSGGDVTIDASGSSDVDLSDFQVDDARVDVSGSSTVTVNPNGRLDVDASGASAVYYVGDPTLGDIDTSGSSSVEGK
jgi:hypothetical protein